MSTKEHQGVVVISGGMGGIGQAIAKKLAGLGYNIALLFHHHALADVHKFMNELPENDHQTFMCDVTDTEGVNSTIHQIVDRMGSLDVCIHTAVSPLIRKRVTAISSADFQQQFNVTLFGGLHLFQATIPWMKKQKSGHIIGLTTEALEPNQPMSGMAGYVCAKHALRGLLRELAKELEPDGIRVNAVAPGFVPTALHQDLPSRWIELLQEKDPSKPMTTPEDVANVIAYLCSEEAAKLNNLSFSVHAHEPTAL